MEKGVRFRKANFVPTVRHMCRAVGIPSVQIIPPLYVRRARSCAISTGQKVYLRLEYVRAIPAAEESRSKGCRQFGHLGKKPDKSLHRSHDLPDRSRPETERSCWRPPSLRSRALYALSSLATNSGLIFESSWYMVARPIPKTWAALILLPPTPSRTRSI